MKELVYPYAFGPAIDQYGQVEGIIDGGYRSSWNTHAERVSRLCDALAHQLGVSPADRFAVLALNSHAYLELWHAAFMGAGVINPLNLRLAPKDPHQDWLVRYPGSQLRGAVRCLVVYLSRSCGQCLFLQSDQYPLEARERSLPAWRGYP